MMNCLNKVMNLITLTQWILLSYQGSPPKLFPLNGVGGGELVENPPFVSKGPSREAPPPTGSFCNFL